MRNTQQINIGNLIILMLALLFMSCSTDPIRKTVEGYVKAHNDHDVDKAMTFFGDSAVYNWKEGWFKKGKKAIQEVEEFDAYTQSHYDVSKIEVRRDTLLCTIEESNNFYTAAGVDNFTKIARFVVEDSKIMQYEFIMNNKSWGEIKEALKPFREWAQREREQEFGQLLLDGEFRYGYNGAKRWMALMDEWSKGRD